MNAVVVELTVEKRDGREVPFDRACIERAIAGAFREELEGEPESASVAAVTDKVIEQIHGQIVAVETIQDLVERELMRSGHYNVARRYIVYRESRARARALRGEEKKDRLHQLRVVSEQGKSKPLDVHSLKERLYKACQGIASTVPEDLISDVTSTLFDGMPEKDVGQALVLSARARIEQEPGYSQVAARLLRQTLQSRSLSDYLKLGVEAELLDPELLTFDLERLEAAIDPIRDEQFSYLGLQTLYDRYLIQIEGERIEQAQHLWMRVAMGLSLKEEQREERAITFYTMLSTFRFVSATPTLFNSGTTHAQLSSCYLSTVKDDLQHIFKVVADNASLSKWAGGIGNDWTNIRSTGAHIKGTNGESQGVIPFLKIVNDTAVAVNQGGKRKGAMCCYLETWHLDIEDFLELRKNTGDERRRTHDMNTANWIPDLFMERVESGGQWTLFSPNEAPDLHDLYGEAFTKRYEEYEAKADAGEIRQFKRIEAAALWRKMLSMLFETGHPWITFKDPSNLRSPQDHVGVVHSSNLCTEILLNTSPEETAVCNLGSINLAEHVTADGVDEKKLAETIGVAVRMLDNVVDINFYPTKEAENSNRRHRPVGLGLMAFQDALHTLRISYASDRAVEFADTTMELISYHAILASTELARERGRYSTFEGSKWDRGLLPMDTIAAPLMDRSSQLDWGPVRAAVKEHGMRNSNVMAIAPTATISNIAGVTQSIEPSYRNLFVKSNLSGEFTVVNEALVADLKARGLWNSQMLEDLKYTDGSIQELNLPEELKGLYLTAFEVEPQWLIACASRRQKWIDQGQSLNLYLAQPLGKVLDEMYRLAWKSGLKTTYYLRSLAATQIEKSSIDINKKGIQPRWMKNKSASSGVQVSRACSIDDPECEACQ